MRFKVRAPLRLSMTGRVGVSGEVAAGSSAPSDALEDWVARSTAAGVVQAIRFNTASNATSYAHADGTESRVVHNATGGIIGDGCLRIEVPASAGANSGSWRAPLNPAWSDFDAFGTTRFYIQFRVKLGPHRLDQSVNGGGFKMMNLAEYRFSSPNSSVSHPGNEIVINNQDWRDILFAYRETPSGTTGLEIPFGGSDFRLQPAVDRGSGVTPNAARYCLYSDNQGCWALQENAWFTIYMVVRIQNYGGTTGNELDIYTARDGETSYTHLFNNRDFLIGSDGSLTEGPNGIWFLPYDTGRTSGPDATYQEYDQLLVSTQPIACPQVSSALALPTWITTNAASVGQWYAMPSTAMSSCEVASPPSGDPSAKVNAWTSMCVDQVNSNLYAAAGGGHGDYSGNEVDRLTLNAATPAWTNVRAPTASVANGTHYSDGRPTSRHHYYGIAFDSHGSDSRVIILGGSRYQDGARLTTMDAFNIGTGDWSAAGTLAGSWDADIRTEEQYPVCRDPRNGNIYAFGQFDIAKWTKATNTWSSPINNQTGPAAYGAASAFDTMRNRIFLVGGAYGARHVYTPDTNTVAQITLSGSASGTVAGIGAGGMVYIPSLDVFLLRAAGSGGTVYQITPSGVCTTFATTGGGSVPATSNGPYNKFLYVPKLKGCVYVPAYASNSWFLRVEA